MVKWSGIIIFLAVLFTGLLFGHSIAAAARAVICVRDGGAAYFESRCECSGHSQNHGVHSGHENDKDADHAPAGPAAFTASAAGAYVSCIDLEVRIDAAGSAASAPVAANAAFFASNISDNHPNTSAPRPLDRPPAPFPPLDSTAVLLI